jgi:protoporphyrinogen oxidase
MTDADLVALVRGEVADLLGARGEPVMADVAVWRDALPQAVAGHAQRLASADAVETNDPRVAFTGAWRDGLSVGEVLRGGAGAALRLAGAQGWNPSTR